MAGAGTAMLAVNAAIAPIADRRDMLCDISGLVATSRSSRVTDSSEV